MTEKRFEGVFLDELGDMYDGEQRLILAMPKLIDRTNSEPLKDELRKHLEQSREHVSRLRQAFELIGETPRRNGCNAMQGLLAESECLVAESSNKPIRDSAILAAAQKIEHYKIATYVTLREWAQQLGHAAVSTLLQQNCDEETAGDEALSHLALTLNNEAARAE